MVTHLCPIHITYAAASVYSHGCVNDTIVKRYHEAGCLEYRTWLQPVCYGMIASFLVFSRLRVTIHVHHSLDIARCNLHDDCYARISAYLLQFLNERTFSKVLNTYVNGGNDVTTVNSSRVEHIYPAIKHLATVLETWAALQDRVICQLKTCVGYAPLVIC